MGARLLEQGGQGALEAGSLNRGKNEGYERGIGGVRGMKERKACHSGVICLFEGELSRKEVRAYGW